MGKRTFKEALALIGNLSKPSKMPWYSWSISALLCKKGGELRAVKNSVCASCYARKGNYVFKNVKAAHERRLAALYTPDFIDSFVQVLTELFEKKRNENRFRWHDSGDLQDVEHLRIINTIAERTPFLIHWLPTKENKIVKDFLDEGGVLASNLIIKVSAPLVGVKFRTQPMGLSFTSVGLETDPELFQCKAPDQGNKCLDCRACWSTLNVNYHKH